MNLVKRYWWVGMVILVLIVGLGIGSGNASEGVLVGDKLLLSPRNESEEVIVEREIIPFEEMTIPYLREREYISELGKMSQYQDRANYTSYLTSYDSDGLRVNGLLTIPKGEMPDGGWPAVVFVHGYIPPLEYKTTEKYLDYVDYLARSGLVVFKIDLRGHGMSEGEASGAYYSGDYVVDVLNARVALQGWEDVNSDRIGLWGHSMAGNVLMRAMTVRPEIERVVIWGGAVFTYEDWQKYGLSDGSYRPPSVTSDRQRRREQLLDEHGSFDPDSHFWKMVPATNYLDGLEGGVQMHHAVDDGVVSVEYSRNMAKLLEQAGVEHEYYEYGSGGHNLSGASFSEAMRRSVEWYLR